ncbi:MAG: hypothetical protein EOP49_27115, partial [Sphingobacteriales bacterium]
HGHVEKRDGSLMRFYNRIVVWSVRHKVTTLILGLVLFAASLASTALLPSGFLPQEREWMELFLSNGFIDTFRHFNKDPHNYTWWSFRANSRAKNLGWRIDYHLATVPMLDRLKKVTILPDAIHSDHCPVLLELIS